MAKTSKNAMKNLDFDSNGMFFDMTKNTVMMAHTQEQNVKPKIAAVREIVKNRNKNEIILVLQQFDFDTAKTIAAFMDGRAVEILSEWNTTSVTKKNKVSSKNRRKRRNNALALAQASGGGLEDDGETTGLDINEPVPDSTVSKSTHHIPTTTNTTSVNGGPKTLKSTVSFPSAISTSNISSALIPDSTSIINQPSKVETYTNYNGHSPESSVSSTTNTTKTTTTTNTSPKQPSHSHTGQHIPHRKGEKRVRLNSGRERYDSINSVSSDTDLTVGVSQKSTKAGSEKHVKDLHRTLASMHRYRTILAREVETSTDRIKIAFHQIRELLDEREETINTEMNEFKITANEMLDKRDEFGQYLLMRRQQGHNLSDAELTKVRNDMKHFNGERRIDEDLCTTIRFMRDHDRMVTEVNNFGEIVPIASKYSESHYPNAESKSSATSPSLGESQSQTQPTEELKSPSSPAKFFTGPADLPDSGLGLKVHIGEGVLTLEEAAQLHQKLHDALVKQGLIHNNFAMVVPGSAGNRQASVRPAQSAGGGTSGRGRGGQRGRGAQNNRLNLSNSAPPSDTVKNEASNSQQQTPSRGGRTAGSSVRGRGRGGNQGGNRGPDQSGQTSNNTSGNTYKNTTTSQNENSIDTSNNSNKINTPNSGNNTPKAPRAKQAQNNVTGKKNNRNIPNGIIPSSG